MIFTNRFVALVFIAFTIQVSYAQMTILSGPENGSYSYFVNDMAEVLASNNHIVLNNKTSGGSAYNFKMLMNPQSNFKMALIQSDYLSLMQAKDKINNSQNTHSIKVVMPLATEQIHLIAKKSSGLTCLQDLNNKRVGIGNEDQGSSSTAKNIKDRSKINWLTNHIGFDQLLKKLYDGNIEAGLIVGSAPMALLDIDPQIMVDELILLELSNFNGWAKYYESDVISSLDYAWLERDIATFGVRTLLVVNEAKLSEEERQTVEDIKIGIIKALPQLKQNGHPKWKTVIIPDEGRVERIVNTAVVSQKNEKSIANEVKYRVQVYSRNYERNEELTIDEKIYSTYNYFYKGAYRYTVGEFNTFSEAARFQKSCRSSGYPQAFVVAFINNERSTDANLFK
ncbi:TAXI family TRAP transporter solute-binding subunit [Carboxylicivirga sp. N1Y90]|uniref:TAXI family TRAP transporter solute-binding subunit n=1 Tax=Carboxylicivirga fragile TaxID=3417571 RepID=UPI003D330B0F|nr:hypothetical protein [Marinilabiliaceae bacterium N1Y90]